MVLVLISGVFLVILSDRHLDAYTSLMTYYMTLFNYGVKKGRDVGLACICHMRFLKGDSHCLPEHKRDGFSFLLYNKNGETLSYKGPRQVGRITFQWRTNSERFSGFQNFDSLRGFFFHVCYIALNQGCCVTCHCILPGRILQHDFNSNLIQVYVNTHYFG